jgi:hypothetical protein
MATSRRKRLFVSFGGLLRALYGLRVSAHQLEDALFYFSCSREYVFEVGVGGEHGELPAEYARNPEDALKAYEEVLDAIRKAEAESRIAWCDQEASWEQLNQLLNANGYPPITWQDSETVTYLQPPLVVLAAQHLGHPLCVFDR